MTGVVLAGGTSARFGRDKLVEPVGGEPMLYAAIRAVAPVCDEVLVSVAADGDVPPTPEDVPVVIVRDDRADEGPLAGLNSAMGQVSTSLVVVVGGDMPFLQHQVVHVLVEYARSHPEAPVVALDDGEAVRPLPSVIRREIASRLGSLVDSGERRLRALVREFPVAAVPPGTWLPLDPERRSLRDVDRPEDLET